MSTLTKVAGLFITIFLLASCKDPVAGTDMITVPEVEVESLALDDRGKPIATISNNGDSIFDGTCLVEKGRNLENPNESAIFVYTVRLQPGMRREFGVEHLTRVTEFDPAEVRSAAIEYEYCFEVRSVGEVIDEKMAKAKKAEADARSMDAE